MQPVRALQSTGKSKACFTWHYAFVKNSLTKEEQVRRSTLANNARDMIRANMTVEAEDETSMTLDYCGYYMQISFSPLHPLLVMCLAKAIRNPGGTRTQQRINELNLHSVLGSHAINNDVGCYSYRALAGYRTHATALFRDTQPLHRRGGSWLRPPRRVKRL